MSDSASLLIARSRVHPHWSAPLQQALASVDPAYLDSLLVDPDWLPGADLLLSAFRCEPASLRYILIGESPYPRAASANGIAFYDAAVGELWSENGLSKPVNRATSLRNIVKTALLAEGRLAADAEGKVSQPAIAAMDKSGLITSLAELFENLARAGFLMLNATPVLHPARKPAQEAKYWLGFLQSLLEQLAAQTRPLPTLVLWGKIAEALEAMPVSQRFEQIKCEHPYNISFIHNPAMQKLFGSIKVLERKN